MVDVIPSPSRTPSPARPVTATAHPVTPMPAPLAPVFARPLAAPILATVERLSGATDGELSDHLGVDRSLIGHWRSGARSMPVEALKPLARYTGRPGDALGPLLTRLGLQVVPDSSTGAALSPMGLVRALSNLTTVAADAFADSELSPQERQALAVAVDEAEVQIRRLRACLVEEPARPREVSRG